MSENKIYSFIGLARKAGAVQTGEELVEKAVKRGKARLVIVAKDASLNTRGKIEHALNGTGIPMLLFGEKERLGHALGKPFFSVIAITDNGFSERIKEMIETTVNYNDSLYGGDLFEQTKNS